MISNGSGTASQRIVLTPRDAWHSPSSSATGQWRGFRTQSTVNSSRDKTEVLDLFKENRDAVWASASTSSARLRNKLGATTTSRSLERMQPRSKITT
jgi:hypothetical protein